MSSKDVISVLVIDDSAHNRRTLSTMLESEPDVRVVDRAADGEEGLKKVVDLKPDVVTLDLEMPKLGGYTFLRLLMRTAPTPVIVISSYSHRSDVFKALELGAFDFIAKPQHPTFEAMEALRVELLEKVRAARHVRPGYRHAAPGARAMAVAGEPPLVVAVGASTGGPPAVQRVLEGLAVEPTPCVLVCQHMPPQFTRAFADRLDRIGPFTVTEARDGDLVQPGHVYIAPGGRHMVVAERGSRLELHTPPPTHVDKYAPSVDRLFASMAQVLGAKALGVVLTGMGADGAEGAREVHRAGGEVWAQSEETSVVFGMPGEAIATGAVKRVIPLGDIGPALAALARRRR
ncbi:protein-glutamate methylesterase/protein-glutamine glutaminase [Myxococcus xanthus]|uniref:Protein-glutamate methylesterase/protein-glutamine glutaminase n=1 Tax=Myxococcus xanthus TaxID=34 RepID=A0AAE6G2Q6_MYXXA|nr:chemotaxis response regulator protein-glutamate methylesterase [Myxococcus xanthus]QDE69707.1 chemotaxis response regulator protein-glutamate methylesterase [Myxococcus xanthus]QDE76986.1 chemotaxis response regulator protein-glutamate methylesterase [Myxococcus xanthus]QDE84377.1 chemotaxis response regulator protein-glutamate methylesterase [Myxococcus xanthus]QDE98544.1 chemotaxis response regulator protein-glutamate methylesterase [Myxococcus xanthus]QDF06249.1 chemotaxis response regul